MPYDTRANQTPKQRYNAKDTRRVQKHYYTKAV